MTQVIKTVDPSVVTKTRVLAVSKCGNNAQVSFPAGKKSRTVHLVRENGKWTDRHGWQWGLPSELTLAQ